MRKLVMTDAAQERVAVFKMRYDVGCSCHMQRFPPCNWCTHPDNPRNVQEEPDAWRELTPQEIRARRVKRKLDLTDD